MRWGPDPNAAKTFIVQFIYKDGNGWAFVNAPTATQATDIFKAQTTYVNARVTNVKETKYYGDNIQICFEGAVTTTPVIIDKKEVDIELNPNSNNAIANSTVDRAYGGIIENTNNTTLL